VIDLIPNGSSGLTIGLWPLAGSTAPSWTASRTASAFHVEPPGAGCAASQTGRTSELRADHGGRRVRIRLPLPLPEVNELPPARRRLLTTLVFLPTLGDVLALFPVPRRRRRRHPWVARLLTFGAEFLRLLPGLRRGFAPVRRVLLRDRPRLDPLRSACATSSAWTASPSLLILLTTLLSFGLGVLLVHCGQKIARLKEYYAASSSSRRGCSAVFCRARLLPLLRVLGGHARPDVLPHRDLGRPRKLYAAMKFFLYTLAGSVLMLSRSSRSTSSTRLGFTAGRRASATLPSFDIVPLPFDRAPRAPPGLQIWLFWAFFARFAIKVPMFPFHTWLPDAHVEAPTGRLVILAGVLLKMGTYGFLRFASRSSRTRLAAPTARSRSRPRDHRHRLRRDGRDGPEGHEEARRVFLGAPPRLRHAGHLRLNGRGLSGAASSR
jgi:hypothetical protein